VFDTAILQAIAHAQIRQRIIGVLAYFNYMRVADTIDSLKLEHRKITVNTASDNQSAANAIANILLSHK
jgi:hypothetical protein